MPTYIVRTHLVSLGFINPVMLVLGTSFAYSRFVVEKFTLLGTEEAAVFWVCFSHLANTDFPLLYSTHAST